MRIDFEGNLLTVGLAAEKLTVNVGKVNKWIKEKQLPIVTRPIRLKNGIIVNQRLIRKFELEKWCEEKGIGVQEELPI